MTDLKRIAVTGGAGQIAYSLLFRIAAGDLLGSGHPVALHILEIPEALPALEGVKMELEDCAFPLLKEIRIGSNAFEIFHEVDYALLIGAKPRGPGMERSDLLQENAKIFIEQGKALNEVANPDVKVVVVGNPCNTNCLIAMSHAPKIPKENFFAMMRLDENRAKAQLAAAADTEVTNVTNLAVWGNHSTTQVPDYTNAMIFEEPATKAIENQTWLKDEFMPIVQKRGAAIIAARGKSSAASAASALIDTVNALINPTPGGDFFSIAKYSAKNPYGIDENLIFSFPCRNEGGGEIDIVEGIHLSEEIMEKIRASEKELIQEREMVSDLLG